MNGSVPLSFQEYDLSDKGRLLVDVKPRGLWQILASNLWWAFLLIPSAFFYWLLACAALWAIAAYAFGMEFETPLTRDPKGPYIHVSAGVISLGGLFLYMRYLGRCVQRSYLKVYEKGVEIYSLARFKMKHRYIKYKDLSFVVLGAPSGIDAGTGVDSDIRRSKLIIQSSNGERTTYPLFLKYFERDSINDVFLLIRKRAENEDLSIVGVCPECGDKV